MRSQHGASPSPLAILLLIAANLLIPVGIVIFGQGFFPYKPLLPGLAQHEDPVNGSPVPAPFDRVIFVVIDALRSDFVYAANSGFQFTQWLIRAGSAIPFTAHAASPTVTMPRIKAITTGSIPSFLDVVLNVDEGDKSSSLASQDTWLAQMKAKDTGKLVLYGDDTWLKLFPGMFDRSDGTSSFFVADFTEVDNNVTRHVADELRHDDWSVMVLHYLGLDHIGHKGGPRSPNMLPKQREMDAIVRQIYEALASQSHLASTLFVLCGDHGMNDAGNHGASSAGETSPALIFIAPKLQATLEQKQAIGASAGGRPSPLADREDFRFYQTVEQSDVAPTLAALLGFPTPKNNLGAFIPDFLSLWPNSHDKVQILMHNARQILRVLEAAFGPEVFERARLPDSALCSGPPPDDIGRLACDWQAVVRGVPSAQSDGADDWIAKAVKWLRDAQQIMSGMASNYDMTKLVFGLTAAASSFCLAVSACFWLVPLSFQELAPFGLITVAYGVMMFASSYVEEEHHFWYWAATAWTALVSIRKLSASEATAQLSGGASHWRRRLLAVVGIVAAFVSIRLIRAWNQTGQKFAGEPDLVKTFLKPSPLVLWSLVLGTYVWTGFELMRGFSGFSSAFAVPGVITLVLAALSFKVVFTLEDSPELVQGPARAFADLATDLGGGVDISLVTRVRLVFAGLAAGTIAVIYSAVAKRHLSLQHSPVETLLFLYTLLAATQSRTTNIPMFPLMAVLYWFLQAQRSPPFRLAASELTTATLLLQFVSFFALGGTNAISSVDLSSAYNGISGFSARLVGVLIFVSNWAAPIYWAIAGVSLLPQSASSVGAPTSLARRTALSVWLQHVGLLTVFAASSLVAVMAACTALRTHLFVWTVFSPKYLYCVAWSLGMHLGVHLGLGGLLCWLSTW